jgi:conjugal transfer pilus assembly protein TraK
VTLVPIDAPPVIVDLTVGLTSSMKNKSVRYLKDLELEEAQAKATNEQVNRSDKHTQRIIDILTPVAQGDLPPGFTLSSEIPVDMRKPCKMAIPHVAGQRLLGGTELVDVVIARNDTDRVYQVREEQCLSGDVIAVGIYKKAYLNPNEEVEIYILRDKHQREVQKSKNRRPRLTLGE